MGNDYVYMFMLMLNHLHFPCHNYHMVGNFCGVQIFVDFMLLICLFMKKLQNFSYITK